MESDRKVTSRRKNKNKVLRACKKSLEKAIVGFGKSIDTIETSSQPWVNQPLFDVKTKMILSS